MNIAGVLTIITLLMSSKPVGEVEMVNVTVVLKVSSWDPLSRPSFRVYVNGSSSIYGIELKVNSSKALVFQVPKGSSLWITGEPEVVGDYGFWYRLESVNNSKRTLEFRADSETVIYLNYSVNHVLLSPYFIAVYLLLGLLTVRRYIKKRA
ncbi:MAG: hypothetical protein QXT26_02490 [Thermoproteota archaeon]